MKGVESKTQGEKSLQPQDAILHRMQTHGIRKNNIYDKPNRELELAAHNNIPVHARLRRRRNELRMVVLEANEDNNPSTSFTSKCVSDKHLQLGGVIRHLHTRCGAAVSVEKEVRSAPSERRRYLQVVDNLKRYSPSKFLKPILNPPVSVTHWINEMNSEGAATTCIILAAQLDDAETIQRLATAGADLNLTDSLGHSALTWAIILNHRDAAMALINCGTNIEVVFIISKHSPHYDILIYSPAKLSAPSQRRPVHLVIFVAHCITLLLQGLVKFFQICYAPCGHKQLS